MATNNKVDIWTPIVSIVGVTLIMFFVINSMTNKTLKQEQEKYQKRERQWQAQIDKNKHKIDSLQVEIIKRDSILRETAISNYTLEQIKKKYESKVHSISTLPIDSAIRVLSEEISDR